MSLGEALTHLPPRRRPSSISPSRPVTSHVSNNACNEPSGLKRVNTYSDRPFGREQTRWKEHPVSQSFGRDRMESPTFFATTTNHAFSGITPPVRTRSPSTSHLSSFKQSLQSLGRKMTVSLRPRGGIKKINTSNVSHATAGTMSSDQPLSQRPGGLQSKGKPSKWLRSSSVSKRRPSIATVIQCADREPPPYSYTCPVPPTSRGPPSLPWDMHTGAAARAAAAAQNEALHQYQRQSLVLNSEMPRISDLKLCRDSESGIGIEMPDQREATQSRINVTRQDPAQVLPVEIMEQILCYLDPPTLARAEGVCRDWGDKARSRYVWRHVFQREYDSGGADGQVSRYCPQVARGVGKGVPDQNWQKMYHLRRQIDGRWAQGKAAAIYLNGHQDSVYCVQFDEHKIVTGSRDRTIRVWDTHNFQCLRKIGPPNHISRRAPVPEPSSPDPVGAFYIQSTSCVDPVDGSPPQDYHDASILCLQFDEQIMVTGSSDKTAIVWSIADNYRPIRRLRGHAAGVLDVCIDEKYIVTCSKDTTICVWDRLSGELIKRLTGHRGPVNAVQMRGNLLASASGDGMAKLWNVRDGLCVKEFSSKDRGLACVEFSEDGRCILAGGNDQVIYEYDTNTGHLVRELIGHKGLVRSLHLDSGNNRVISGSYDMSIKVWDGGRGSGPGQARPKINFPGWTTSWMLAAKSDYRKIVCTSQDGRVVIMDFGYGLDGVEMLEA